MILQQFSLMADYSCSVHSFTKASGLHVICMRVCVTELSEYLRCLASVTSLKILCSCQEWALAFLLHAGAKVRVRTCPAKDFLEDRAALDLLMLTSVHTEEMRSGLDKTGAMG